MSFSRSGFRRLISDLTSPHFAELFRKALIEGSPTPTETATARLIHNEKIKLQATFLNNLGVGVAIGGSILPFIQGFGAPLTFGTQPSWLVALRIAIPWMMGTCFHRRGRHLLKYLRQEDAPPEKDAVERLVKYLRELDAAKCQEWDGSPYQDLRQLRADRRQTPPAGEKAPE